MKSLFDQTQVGPLKLKNRFIRSATYEGMADEKGNINDELFKVYEDLAKGGVGTIITGITSVTDLEEFIQAKWEFIMIHLLIIIKKLLK